MCSWSQLSKSEQRLIVVGPSEFVAVILQTQVQNHEAKFSFALQRISAGLPCLLGL